MTMIKSHASYKYAKNVVEGKINAPKYVKKQAADFLEVANGKNKKYVIDEKKLNLIDNLLKLMIMPKGLKVGERIYDCLVGFQFFLIVAILCVVHRADKKKRRYQKALLEICRKNGKTFLIAVIFILLFLLEPKFSKFYSVAPDGSLSREIKEAIEEILASSLAIQGDGLQKFKVKRDEIICKLNKNKYVPLNYSNSRLDGKLPSVFLIDETGALPNPYAIEAMSSGQLTIKNKLGCIISTKYPKINNPFEGEVLYAKRVLDGLVEDETLFALLYEPDNTQDWEFDDGILEQANPLALDVPEIMEDLKKKRQEAIEVEQKRENFVTKHCNIIYTGVGTESFVSLQDLQKGRRESIDWSGRDVWLGVDLSMTTDNTSVAMVAEEDGKILAKSWAFIPEDRIEEKTKVERVDYRQYIRAGNCIACGQRTIDYLTVEDFVLGIEEKFGVNVQGLAYDRYNCLSSAQKWMQEGIRTVEMKQHSSVLHPATKLIQEKVADGNFLYEPNTLLEINFENARCTEDTNKNKYVNKKKSDGKVDMVVSTINAVAIMQQDVVFYPEADWSIQTF